MVKRKKSRKESKKKTEADRQFREIDREARKKMPVPEFAIKVLSGILAAITVAALTLYVLDAIPARGFWTLAIILAILAFVVVPMMRKRFVEGS